MCPMISLLYHLPAGSDYLSWHTSHLFRPVVIFPTLFAIDSEFPNSRLPYFSISRCSHHLVMGVYPRDRADLGAVHNSPGSTLRLWPSPTSSFSLGSLFSVLDPYSTLWLHSLLLPDSFAYSTFGIPISHDPVIGHSASSWLFHPYTPKHFAISLSFSCSCSLTAHIRQLFLYLAISFLRV
jgi:hypothetical protein